MTTWRQRQPPAGRLRFAGSGEHFERKAQVGGATRQRTHNRHLGRCKTAGHRWYMATKRNNSVAGPVPKNSADIRGHSIGSGEITAEIQAR